MWSDGVTQQQGLLPGAVDTAWSACGREEVGQPRPECCEMALLSFPGLESGWMSWPMLSKWHHAFCGGHCLQSVSEGPCRVCGMSGRPGSPPRAGARP